MTQGTLVMVKMSRTADGGIRSSDVYYSVEWAINDIVTRGRQGKSVINLSITASKLTATAFISICILICYQPRMVDFCGLILPEMRALYLFAQLEIRQMS
jgi:hypothetical protein